MEKKINIEDYHIRYYAFYNTKTKIYDYPMLVHNRDVIPLVKKIKKELKNEMKLYYIMSYDPISGHVICNKNPIEVKAPTKIKKSKEKNNVSTSPKPSTNEVDDRPNS